MKDCISLAIALLCVLPCPVSAQPTFDGVERFHDAALRPAMQAVTKNDVVEARRLARVLLTEFEKLPPALQMGQVADVQRLSRLYLEAGLVPEADLLLTRVAAAWEGPVMNTPFSPLGPLYADLARARRLTGKLTEAEALLKRAQALRGTEPTQTDPDAYPIFVEIAEVRRLRGDADGAETLLRKMVGFSERMKGWEYVPNLIGVFEAYATHLEQTGRTSDARQFRSRANTIRKNYARPVG